MDQRADEHFLCSRGLGRAYGIASESTPGKKVFKAVKDTKVSNSGCKCHAEVAVVFVREPRLGKPWDVAQ